MTAYIAEFAPRTRTITVEARRGTQSATVATATLATATWDAIYAWLDANGFDPADESAGWRKLTTCLRRRVVRRPGPRAELGAAKPVADTGWTIAIRETADGLAIVTEHAATGAARTLTPGMDEANTRAAANMIFAAIVDDPAAWAATC